MTIKELKKIIKKRGLRDDVKIRVVVNQYAGDMSPVEFEDFDYDLVFESAEGKELKLRAETPG